MKFLTLMAVVILTVVGSTFVGAYFWIPAWYGWVSLAVGIISTFLLCYLAYQSYLFITFQGPYAKK